MKTEIYASILQNIANGKKMLAVLIDPDKCTNEHLQTLIPLLKEHTPNFIFVGGSQLKISFSNLIEILVDIIFSCSYYVNGAVKGVFVCAQDI